MVAGGLGVSLAVPSHLIRLGKVPFCFRFVWKTTGARESKLVQAPRKIVPTSRQAEGGVGLSGFHTERRALIELESKNRTMCQRCRMLLQRGEAGELHCKRARRAEGALKGDNMRVCDASEIELAVDRTGSEL